MFIQKILEHGHARSFASFKCCFPTTMAALSTCYRDQIACNAYNIYYLAFSEKTFLTPGIEHSAYPIVDTEKLLAIIFIFFISYVGKVKVQPREFTL